MNKSGPWADKVGPWVNNSEHRWTRVNHGRTKVNLSGPSVYKSGPWVDNSVPWVDMSGKSGPGLTRVDKVYHGWMDKSGQGWTMGLQKWTPLTMTKLASNVDYH